MKSIDLDMHTRSDALPMIRTRILGHFMITVICAILLAGCDSDLPPAEQQLAELDSLERVIRSQQVDLERLDRATDPINTFQLQQLSRRGFDRPHDQLLADLQKQEELIKFEGVLGGQMQFRKISLLTNRWVMAEFDDGHIQGYALLEMAISKDGNVEWKLLDSYVQ